MFGGAWILHAAEWLTGEKVQESNEGRLLHGKFHPNQCKGGVHKTENFKLISTYKRPTRAYPLGDLYYIVTDCVQLNRRCYILKLRQMRSRSSGVTGVSEGCVHYPKLAAPPGGRSEYVFGLSNNAARLGRSDHVTHSLIQLHWLLVIYRVTWTHCRTTSALWPIQSITENC